MSNRSPLAEKLLALTKEEQDPAIVEAVCLKVEQILTSNETIQYVAVQKKPIVNFAPDCVVLTNRRFIVYRPQVLGGVSFEDNLWRDLLDATLQEHMLRATIRMKTITGKFLAVDNLPKVQARRVYAFAQEMEERVREERRRRELEDKRAAAGGVFVSSKEAQAPAESPVDAVQRMKALKDMLDAGLISASEFEGKRAEIISKM